MAHVPTGRVVGIDVGLHAYLMDSEGQAVANPRFIHHVEQRVRRRSRWLSRKSLHHQQGKQGKKPTQNHAARQRARHNRYPPVAATAPQPTPPTSPPPPTSLSVPTPPAPATRLSSPTPRRRQSANWHKARHALAKTYVHLQRQREDFARKQANALVSSRPAT